MSTKSAVTTLITAIIGALNVVIGIVDDNPVSLVIGYAGVIVAVCCFAWDLRPNA